jgi:L-ribulose-5-phosphate 4-epimerase
MIEKLKEQVFLANLELKKQNLVIDTWGNVSGIDRDSELVVIKPSGVAYETLTVDDMVVMDLGGRVVEGRLRPSSDTPTHLYLYRHFPEIGGVVHTHSKSATAWAQSNQGIPCLGTTHADYFYGEIPCTRQLTKQEIAGDYEINTGKVIVERFGQLDYVNIPAVLVANHGPFTWGVDAVEAVHHSVVLEEVAKMALAAKTLNPHVCPISPELLKRHFLRKHGREAYYGQ